MLAFVSLYPGQPDPRPLVEVIHQCPCCDLATIKYGDGHSKTVMPSYLEFLPEEISSRGFKVLKFAQRMPAYILAGERLNTWRIDDHQNVEAGDMIRLATNDGHVFGVAEVLWTKSTLFGRLTTEDKDTHQLFSSDSEMFATYSRYYKRSVGPETAVKVIRFRLLSIPAAALSDPDKQI